MGKSTGSKGIVRGCAVVVLALAALLCAAPAGAQPPPIGGLTQLTGQAGCVSSDGSGGSCGTGLALDAAESSVLSPDGSFLYITSAKGSGTEPGVSIFSRSPASGALMQLPQPVGCLTADGGSQQGMGACTAVRGLDSVGDGRDLAFTSDGQSGYLVGQGGPSPARPTVMLFSRDPGSGALTQQPGTSGCISDNGFAATQGGACQTDATLKRPVGITISPDNAFVYVTDSGYPSAIEVFSRDQGTGQLSQVQCLAVAPGRSGCTTVRDAGDANSFSISSDGTHAYSADAAANGVSVFDRDPSTGFLTQKSASAGCASSTGKDNTGAATCSHGVGLVGAYGLALSPNEQNLYVSSIGDQGIAVFNLAGDGTLSQPSGTDACVTIDGKSAGVPGRCATGRALTAPSLPTIAPNGRALYVPSKDSTSGGVAVFSVDASSGKLSQLPNQDGCVTADGSSGGTPGVCATGTAVAGGSSIAVDPSGATAYLAASTARAVAAFHVETGPACSPINVSTPYMRPVTIPLTCVDADGDVVTRTIVSAPANGTLGPIDQTGGTVTYTPSASFTRSDNFTFSASDGTNASAPTLVSIRASDPRLTQVQQSRSSWRRSRGTKFTFKLNESATVTLTFERIKPGRRVNHMCQPQSSTNAGRPSCTLSVVVGRIKVAARAGMNAVHFKGHLNNGRVLRSGSYKVWVVADNSAGSSASKLLHFTVS